MSENSSTAPPPPPANPTPERVWHMSCHLSALAGLLVPFGNILGPLIIWQMKKHELPSMDPHGKAAVNFQISVTLVAIAGFVVALGLSFVCVGYLLFPLVAAVAVCGLVFAVVAGVKANDGQEFRYPWSIEFIK